MQSEQSNATSQQLAAAIKKTWNKLTDQEVALYKNEATRTRFFDAVKTRYGISQEEAAKTLKKLESENNSSGSFGTAKKTAQG